MSKFRFRVYIPEGFDDKGERVEYVYQTLDDIMEGGDILIRHSMTKILTTDRFTNLKDQDNVEIYENDMIWTDHNIAAGLSLEPEHEGIMEWAWAGEWVLKSGIMSQSVPALVRNKWKLKVTGNVHNDNPEIYR